MIIPTLTNFFVLKRDKEKKEKHQFEFPFKEPKHKEHNI